MGLLAERGMGRSMLSTALAMLAGNLVIYLFGYAWLASLIGPGKAFVFGVQPFLWGGCDEAGRCRMSDACCLACCEGNDRYIFQ